MSMVCPKCNSVFSQALQCPSCRVRLVFDAHASKGAGLPLDERTVQWQHQPLGRIFVGVLMAQGLAHGLLLLVTGSMLATDEASRSTWVTLMGLVLMQTIHAISLLVGGALAGATQHRGWLLGAVVGVGHGILFAIYQHFWGDRPTEVTLYGHLMLHVFFGLVGGLLGSLIWRPLPTMKFPEREPAPKMVGPGFRVPGFRGRVAWARVFIGFLVVACGLIWPKVILDLAVQASLGHVSLGSHLQAQLIMWELTGLATLLGAAFAGANTSNGPKQGMVLAFTASLVVFGNYLTNRSVMLEPTLLVIACVSVLCMVGAWFGGQLFPPVLQIRRRGASHLLP